ncbi:MAG: protein tyrosine phosphatase [Marivivens sp.]|jgi:protein tyrosine phosphatase (PTP) superfamily phosphohydrolase (DUF442 family)|nr:protein tyrosine phosphatase [Marivivens sp.]
MWRLAERFQSWEQSLHSKYGRRVGTPQERRDAEWYVRWVDHGALRAPYHNFGKVADGVFRSNQPDHARLVHYQRAGIETILNLRGADPHAFYLFEQESCAALGIALVDHAMEARKAMSVETLTGLLDHFEQLPRPFLMHCKSGADRTSIAAALWKLHMEKRSLAAAWGEMSFGYLHIQKSRTGILDMLLASYGEYIRDHKAIPVREWIEEKYDPQALEARFERFRLAGYRLES